MRDGLREILSGWMLLDDLGALDDRIRRAMIWLADNRPVEPDEESTIEFMIESGITRATGEIVDGYLRRAGIATDTAPLPDAGDPKAWDEYGRRFRPGT